MGEIHISSGSALSGPSEVAVNKIRQTVSSEDLGNNCGPWCLEERQRGGMADVKMRLRDTNSSNT